MYRFYEDNENFIFFIKTLLKKIKLKLSKETVNLLVNRASGNRENLKNELEKLLNFIFK